MSPIKDRRAVGVGLLFGGDRKRLVHTRDAVAQAEDWLTMFGTVTASAGSIRMALDSAASDRASYWDARLIASAAEAGCTTILTKDVADGTLLRVNAQPVRR